MLRLRKQIGGNVRRIGGFVGQHRDFARAGHHVERHLAINQPLGGGHVRAARADNFLHLGDRLRAVGHQTDGLDAADLVNLSRTGQIECIKNVGVHIALAVGGRTSDQLRNAGNLRERQRHQRGGSQRRGPAGDVSADAVERYKFFAEPSALRGGHFPVLAQTGHGKLGNPFVRLFGGRLKLGIHRFFSGGDLGFRNLQLHHCARGPIKLAGVFEHGTVAAALNVFEHLAGNLVRSFFNWRTQQEIFDLTGTPFGAVFKNRGICFFHSANSVFQCLDLSKAKVLFGTPKRNDRREWQKTQSRFSKPWKNPTFQCRSGRRRCRAARRDKRGR